MASLMPYFGGRTKVYSRFKTRSSYVEWKSQDPLLFPVTVILVFQGNAKLRGQRKEEAMYFMLWKVGQLLFSSL